MRYFNFQKYYYIKIYKNGHSFTKMPNFKKSHIQIAVSEIDIAVLECRLQFQSAVFRTLHNQLGVRNLRSFDAGVYEPVEKLLRLEAPIEPEAEFGEAEVHVLFKRGRGMSLK
jgi:hypothetical protein